MAALAMSDEVDLELSVPLSSLVDEVTCPICFAWCKSALMTPCGHNFCNNCLSECLNRSKKCPVCSQPVPGGVSSCVDNKHHDRLVAILRVEREKASKRYFEDLIGGSNSTNKISRGSDSTGDRDCDSATAAAAMTALSPIEEVFHAHLKKGLLAYEHYFESIREKFRRAIADAKQTSEVRCQLASERLGSDPERKAELDELVAREAAKREAVVAELEESLKVSTALLVESYGTYLKEAIPEAPQFLPVAVAIEVPSKSLSLKRVVLKPTDSANDVLALIAAKLEAMGNPLVKLCDDCRWKIRAPFAAVDGAASTASPPAASAAATGHGKHKHRNKTVIRIKDPRTPLLQHGIMPGATIVLDGTVQCKDDLPKQCFRQVFEKGKDLVVDYFSCRDCRVNWLCKSCAEACHSDHRVVEYMPQHKPSWACCYCFKSKRCQLASRKSAENEQARTPT